MKTGSTAIRKSFRISWSRSRKTVSRCAAPNSDAITCWLKVVGSKAGQEAFNPLKGSICARTDCDASLFDDYLKSAMSDWKQDKIVPSLAHGGKGQLHVRIQVWTPHRLTAEQKEMFDRLAQIEAQPQGETVGRRFWRRLRDALGA